MRCFCAVALLSCLLVSCTRSKDTAGVQQSSAVRPSSAVQPPSAARPLAVLQAGKYPLWFQFTDDGPVLLETIEDACFSTAFVPWPLARHIRFVLARGDEIMMAVNHDGFISLSPWQDGKQNSNGIGLYRFWGGAYWRRYTVGAFVLLGESNSPLAGPLALPLVLLYRDDRFVDTDQPVPPIRLWTFDSHTQSASPYTRTMPLLDAFSPEEGWNIDAFRPGTDGYWYFRAVRKTGARPEIRMFKTLDFAMPGEQVSLGAFQNSALPEPVSAAPQVLGEMLALVFSETDYKAASVVSPEFPSARFFASDRESGGALETSAIAGFYSGDFFLAVTVRGEAFYIKTGAASMRRFSLPALPEGFVYTNIGMIADTVIAVWEEQEGYSVGTAGFMVIEFDSNH